MIFDHAARDPDGLAVNDLVRKRSWSQLAERSVRAARYLREEAGLAPGDHVALLMENRVEYVELILGAIMAGVWITPINWHLAREEIAYVIEDSDAKLLVIGEQHEETARAMPVPAERILRAGPDLDAALARASSEPMPGDGPAGGNMIYTSGTSGRPKGVKRARPESVTAALENLGRLGENIGLDGSGPHLITGPMYHAAPLMFAVYDNANGAPIFIMPRWDETLALALIARHRVAHTHFVPTMFVRMLKLPMEMRKAFRAPELSLVLHGAAPVARTVKYDMLNWWGKVLVEYWGATEGGVNTLVDSADWLAHPGTVGRALPAFEIFARGENGERLPPGEVGDLYCRHRSLDRVFEYHGDPEKTAAAHPEPGVFTIGDVGYVDDEGYVFLCDRKSNTIISGGVNIYPAEIEQVLQRHPAVQDVAVFGIPDDEWGESVKAAVELAPGFVASPRVEGEILGYAGEHLARYKVPRSIDFEDELPRHPTGKLYTRLLRDRYWQGRDRSI